MPLLYWKCSLCLTKTSWSYSVLVQVERGRTGPWAALVVWNTPFKIEANLASFRIPALLTGQVPWQNGSQQQCCPIECTLCVVFCVVLCKDQLLVFSRKKESKFSLGPTSWYGFLKKSLWFFPSNSHRL